MDIVIIIILLAVLILISLRVGAYCRKLMSRSSPTLSGTNGAELTLTAVVLLFIAYALFMGVSWTEFVNTRCWPIYGRYHESYVCGTPAIPTGLVITTILGGFILTGFVIAIRKKSK